MTVLVTGAAGFIGFHVARRLLRMGETVIGVDNVNDYYDVALKEARLGVLASERRFSCHRIDIADQASVDAMIDQAGRVDAVVHLAGQAGVRYSLVNPLAYIRSNVQGHVVLLEACRRLKQVPHVVYASSSSVYGGNTKLPFSVDDPTDHPVSLYGATKKTMEVISQSYATMFGMRLTGLRFFTVYGPWGRPDMAAFLFARRIVAGKPIPVFNHGAMRRDFTYIDDIVDGILAAMRVPEAPLHRLYNLGNHKPERLLDFVATVEAALGRSAVIDLQPMQSGDVKETYADIDTSRRDLGFEPKTTIEEGIPRFVDWFCDYYGVAR
jgi:Nucleoside-diphosphate-sugar epimerases